MAEDNGAVSRLVQARQRFSAGEIAVTRHECEAILTGTSNDAERTGAHLLLAACCRSDGDLDAALIHARAAIAIAPGDPIAHYAMAEIREAAGDAKGALTSVERALELNPRFVQAHHYRGHPAWRSGSSAGDDGVRSPTGNMGGFGRLRRL